MSANQNPTVSSGVLDKPRYYQIQHREAGAVDRRGKPLVCMNGDGKEAVWTGVRRPAARIMRKPFQLCDECWKEERKK